MGAGLGSRIFVTAFSAAVLSCTSQPADGPGRNPTARMAVEAPGGYPDEKAAQRNTDGIDHLGWEHWRKAAADFRRAIDADPRLAAAHFNLALALDQLGRHGEAAVEFRAALELSPKDSRIAGNEILKAHLEEKR